jgi:hypothetical protein
MADCYALNVETDNTAWVCYHTDFPLVRIVDNQVSDYWWSPVKGSYHFAIWRDFVLFCNGYRENNRYHLYKLGDNHQMEHIATYSVKDGNTLSVIAGRKDTITFMREFVFYRVTIPELLHLQNR